MMYYTSKYGFELKKDTMDAGYDLRCGDDIVLWPGQKKVVSTGICLDASFFPGTFSMVVPRSSAGTKKDLMLQNTVGIIDPSYRGDGDEIMVAVFRRFSLWAFLTCLFRPSQRKLYNKGERFAQLILLPYRSFDSEMVSSLGNEDRGGFGSTGNT